MLQLPSFYKNQDASPFDCVYKALRNKDLADCVLLTTSILEQSNNWIEFDHKEKSLQESYDFIQEGEKAYKKDEYQISLMRYNNALMRAPPQSGAMMLAYYGRAELLMKAKQYEACMKDVDKCFALNCADFMAEKLRGMQALASGYLWQQNSELKKKPSSFTEEFFTLKGVSNPDIPCATSHVEVNMESGQPKVVAARDIPVGTVVAVETAFVGDTNVKNNVSSCHYCHKMDLNLIPCEGCCSVMFCGERCKDKAMHDGHYFECKINNIIPSDIKLPVRATLKIRQLCSSWDEFIIASNELGIERMKNSSITEIFGSQKFSLLNSYNDTHFLYGAMFNRCLYLANIIHYLDVHTSFLPDSPEEKSAAIRAVARVMMHLALHCTPVQPKLYTKPIAENRTTLHDFLNKGYFPFIGNLPNSCLPNSYVVGLRNSAALITIAPVKKGAELTFSYTGHWLEEVSSELSKRATKMFHQYRTVCEDCIVCSELNVDNISLNSCISDTQNKAFKKFMAYYERFTNNFSTFIINQSEYTEICKILLALSDAPRSQEYANVFLILVQCFMYCVQSKYPNVIFSRYEIA